MAGSRSRSRSARRALEERLKRVQRTRERLQSGFAPVAWCIGWLGIAGLGLCAVLTWAPERFHPRFLSADHLSANRSVYWIASLVASSFLGWTCIQAGVEHLRQRFGRHLGGLLFVVLPLVSLVLVELQHRGWADIERWPKGALVLRIALWLPPAVILTSLVAYLADHSRTYGRIRLGRGLWTSFLVLPYAVLMALLVFHLPVPLVGEHWQSALRELGSGALFVQLTLAFFFGRTTGV